MPSATFHESIAVNAPPDAVWDKLQEPSIWQSIGPVQNLWDPTFDDGVLTGFQWSTDVGGVVYNGTGTAVIRDRPSHYELVLDTSEVAGTIAVALTENDNGSATGIDVTLELRSKGLLSSMFFPMVSRAIGDGFPDQVQDLAVRIDT
jgi:carbon monoxide dehydrogenase subunit G